MSNLAKYATIAALIVGLGVAATKPASAWGYGYDPNYGYGYGYGAFPDAYGFAYPHGYYGYRPFYDITSMATATVPMGSIATRAGNALSPERAP
jgi:hypothetical protein